MFILGLIIYIYNLGFFCLNIFLLKYFIHSSLIMSNLIKLEFGALDILRKNYLSWILDIKIHLDIINFGITLKGRNDTPLQEHVKALIFLCHHIDQGLKGDYVMLKETLILWSNLRKQYDYQNIMILPRAHYDWLYLRLQDFKFANKYNCNNLEVLKYIKILKTLTLVC